MYSLAFVKDRVINEKAKYRSKIEGTEKHDLENEKMRETRKINYKNSNGTEKHHAEKEKLRETRKTFFKL